MTTVRFFAGARAAAGVSEVTSTAETVAELRADLAKRLGPDLERVLTVSTLLIDGVTGHDPMASLPADSTVDVLPPFAGG
ncbi:molybdopterin converting factor small subunit [Stackebrandtia albiflava]|uniref:Molybdopterin converting factor small subunit n=1 Tax=Stackebrandtia albiflava TaxID=406432 RepID=A0A562V1I7_9ACTN|nr:MoaD/ThiS family protein [Stackebrandtia albiflava]TWJ11734.1 molybdopterin converting factor small subunit [Stackebrandtia albiflava]